MAAALDKDKENRDRPSESEEQPHNAAIDIKKEPLIEEEKKEAIELVELGSLFNRSSGGSMPPSTIEEESKDASSKISNQ